MFIDVQQLPPEGQGFEREIPAERLSSQADVRLVRRVLLSGRLTPVDRGGICVLGKMAAYAELACVRCLEPFVVEIEEELNLLYLPQSANVGPTDKDQERELADEDLAVGYYRDDKIDLSQMVWEQVYLALPMKPLCKQDCRGLCPECGTNLNHSACSCNRQTVDPRLASLKTLLKS